MYKTWSPAVKSIELKAQNVEDVGPRNVVSESKAAINWKILVTKPKVKIKIIQFKYLRFPFTCKTSGS